MYSLFDFFSLSNTHSFTPKKILSALPMRSGILYDIVMHT